MSETKHKVYIDRSFACSPHELYNWLTDPQLIVQWFGPPDHTVSQVTNDLRVGGHYDIVLRRAGGNDFSITGTYLELIPGRLIVFEMQYQGLPTPPPPSEVRIVISQNEDGQAQMTFSQSFELLPADMPKRKVAWRLMFDRLDLLCSGMQEG